MPSNNNNNKNRNGPPPWANGRNVERDGDTVSVGRSPAADARERAQSASSQLDRVEAKLDLVLAQLEDS